MFNSDNAELTVLNGVNDIKGQFYGKYQENHPVTVFHIENLYAYVWKLVNGIIEKDKKLLVKMTPGIKDSSTATDYNTTGTGYIDTGIVYDKDSTYIKDMSLKLKWGMFPLGTPGGSASTYYCDKMTSTEVDGRVGHCRIGGQQRDALSCGIFNFIIRDAVTLVTPSYGVCLSYK